VTEFASAHCEVSVDVVGDRFHIAENYRECVDNLRKQECRHLKKELSKAQYAEIQGVLWPIRKNSKDITAAEAEKLDHLFQYSPDLKIAYTFREELSSIFELPLTIEEANEQIGKWPNKVSQTLSLIRLTLNNWLDKIVNYFEITYPQGQTVAVQRVAQKKGFVAHFEGQCLSDLSFPSEMCGSTRALQSEADQCVSASAVEHDPPG
jgi:hypothetical protein